MDFGEPRISKSYFTHERKANAKSYLNDFITLLVLVKIIYDKLINN